MLRGTAFQKTGTSYISYLMSGTEQKPAPPGQYKLPIATCRSKLLHAPTHFLCIFYTTVECHSMLCSGLMLALLVSFMPARCCAKFVRHELSINIFLLSRASLVIYHLKITDIHPSSYNYAYKNLNARRRDIALKLT